MSSGDDGEGCEQRLERVYGMVFVNPMQETTARCERGRHDVGPAALGGWGFFRQLGKLSSGWTLRRGFLPVTEAAVGVEGEGGRCIGKNVTDPEVVGRVG